MPRPEPLRLLRARLFRWGQAPGSPAPHSVPAPGGNGEDPLLEAGRHLRQARESRNLNLRQLALETRISTPVLEALERGWRDRLPEGAYLRTMLPLIEHHLDLPSGTFDIALPVDQPTGALGRQGRYLRFTPGSIDVFTTWQGTLLYGALTLGLIYAINLQQARITAANLVSLRPVPVLTPQAAGARRGNRDTLLQLFPELRPLNLAERGVALGHLKQGPAPSASALGVLQLSLGQPSSLELQSAGGQRSRLEGAQGELVLQLTSPIQVVIDPAPPTGGVLWNGSPLGSVPGRPGHYQWPTKAAPSSAGNAPSPQRP